MPCTLSTVKLGPRDGGHWVTDVYGQPAAAEYATAGRSMSTTAHPGRQQAMGRQPDPRGGGGAMDAHDAGLGARLHDDLGSHNTGRVGKAGYCRARLEPAAERDGCRWRWEPRTGDRWSGPIGRAHLLAGRSASQPPRDASARRRRYGPRDVSPVTTSPTWIVMLDGTKRCPSRPRSSDGHRLCPRRGALHEPPP